MIAQPAQRQIQTSLDMPRRPLARRPHIDQQRRLRCGQQSRQFRRAGASRVRQQLRVIRSALPSLRGDSHARGRSRCAPAAAPLHARVPAPQSAGSAQLGSSTVPAHVAYCPSSPMLIDPARCPGRIFVRMPHIQHLRAHCAPAARNSSSSSGCSTCSRFVSSVVRSRVFSIASQVKYGGASGWSAVTMRDELLAASSAAARS